MDLSQLSGLPLFIATDSLTIDEIYNLCKADKNLNLNLCENENFWKYRYILENGVPEISPVSWKGLYLQPTEVYVFGQAGDGQMGL